MYALVLYLTSFPLYSRFIINVPEAELASVERICFQVEQAHWFYEDFIREIKPDLPSFQLKTFSARNILFIIYIEKKNHCNLLSLTLFNYFSSTVLYFINGLMNTNVPMQTLCNTDFVFLFVEPSFSIRI